MAVACLLLLVDGGCRTADDDERPAETGVARPAAARRSSRAPRSSRTSESISSSSGGSGIVWCVAAQTRASKPLFMGWAKRGPRRDGATRLIESRIVLQVKHCDWWSRAIREHLEGEVEAQCRRIEAMRQRDGAGLWAAHECDDQVLRAAVATVSTATHTALKGGSAPGGRRRPDSLLPDQARSSGPPGAQACVGLPRQCRRCRGRGHEVMPTRRGVQASVHGAGGTVGYNPSLGVDPGSPRTSAPPSGLAGPKSASGYPQTRPKRPRDGRRSGRRGRRCTARVRIERYGPWLSRSPTAVHDRGRRRRP